MATEAQMLKQQLSDITADTLAAVALRDKRISELEFLLIEWRDWYRASLGTGYSEASLPGRTELAVGR